MRERESQIERDVTVDVDALDGSAGPDPEAERESETTDSDAVQSRLGSIATKRSLTTALVASVVGVVVFSFIPFLSIAGAAVGGGATLLGNLIVALVASGATLVGFAILAGAVAGVVGHYFGRDLRAGLTADLD